MALRDLERIDEVQEPLDGIEDRRGDVALSDAVRDGSGAGKKAAALGDFYAYLPEHRYIYEPTRDLWPPASVNARIGPITLATGTKVKASDWLDKNQSVDQMTWAPGEPTIIENRLIDTGGWVEREGSQCFNLYRSPQIGLGNPRLAQQWLDHVGLIYPDHTDHILRWLAHRLRRPWEKVNHALVLGGPQGIGKDTLLEPARFGVGPWNCQEISPRHLLGRFNGFAKSVILRISEARDLGEVDRFTFYEQMKSYTAAPPDVLRCDEKNIREYPVVNCCGVIITSNHKVDGIYLPADDRRHYVAWSQRTKDDFTGSYWRDLWAWYQKRGGIEHVAAYLRSVDLSEFDPKAPPPKTPAWWEIVDANRAPEDAELADALDKLQNPEAITIGDLIDRVDPTFADWLRDRRNSRRIPHRLQAAGYDPVRNDGAKDGLWKVSGKRQVIYAKRELTGRDRIAAAQQMAGARYR